MQLPYQSSDNLQLLICYLNMEIFQKPPAPGQLISSECCFAESELPAFSQVPCSSILINLYPQNR